MTAHTPIQVRTVSDPADPSDFEVLGASLPEAQLASLIARDRFVDVVNQDGVRLQLSFDMDTETLVCERLEPEAAPLVDRVTGAGVRLSRYATLDIPFAHQERGASRAAYDDLIGPNIATVMASVGWRYDGAMLRMNALSAIADPRIVASSWAGTIRSSDGARGVNVSYGVGASHRGAGLSRLLAYCAVAECVAHQVLAGEPLPTFVNIQARATNAASLAVARSLGVPACPEACFCVPEEGRQVAYVGFRDSVVDFLARGLEHTVDRLPGYDPGSMAAARIGIVGEAGSSLGLLGWLDSAPRDDAPDSSLEQRQRQ
ncbi:hypothetical protein [Variovorax ginsengisoli]|uniref:N-acetyltransferase domain-containing protein n=1 Tax=Variovorax ginsengisoli TaxID=363844 RepID=A0ABT8SD52_9BURK|nr:hypothetical protein [Variovorax ginsengisoli]MDN8617188.1 hypothetical protein [Variovorax ginsengisoli]MDO1536358.1 hypothetical protein [Variovorax ginsengisoli]